MAKNKGFRSENGTGYTYKDNKGKWHCIIQTNFVNPKTLKIKKFHKSVWGYAHTVVARVVYTERQWGDIKWITDLNATKVY